VISESRVKPYVALTVKELILDGVERGKIRPNVNIKFGVEVSVEKSWKRNALRDRSTELSKIFPLRAEIPPKHS
jgi:hypothetical protein